MADNYLAMYLSIKFDFLGPTIFVPVRLFAERMGRLGRDITNEAYFTTIAEARDAAERIRLHSPFMVCVLLDSTLAARDVILKKPIARRNMITMFQELDRIADPSGKLMSLSTKEINMSLHFGMKNIRTQYPDPFVMPFSFESDGFVIQVNDCRVSMQVGFNRLGIFTAVNFHSPTGQIFMVNF